MVLVACKCDFTGAINRVISPNEVAALAYKLGVPFFETSTVIFDDPALSQNNFKYQQNVNNAFSALFDNVIQHYSSETEAVESPCKLQ